MKEVLVSCVKKNFPDAQCVAALDARGFLFGPLIALELQLPFIPIRKRGKLPGKILSEEYSLEYGTVRKIYIYNIYFLYSALQDVLQIQQDSIKDGVKVLLVDDLLATGGSLAASCKLIHKCNAEVVGCLVIIELEALQGASRINVPLHSLIKY